MQRLATTNGGRILPARLRYQRRSTRQFSWKDVSHLERPLSLFRISHRSMARASQVLCYQSGDSHIHSHSSMQLRSFTSSSSRLQSTPITQLVQEKEPSTTSAEDEEMDALLNSTDNRYIFREKLNNWYRKHFDVSLKDAFTTTALDPTLVPPDAPSQQLWTSTFTCPITGHAFDAKFLPNNEYRQFHPDDNKAYFATKKGANQAAAMNALFCVSPELAHIPANGEPIDAQKYSAIISKSELQLWYMTHHKTMFTEDAFVTKKTIQSGKPKQGGTWWTAFFQCPITKELFPTMEIPEHEHCTIAMEIDNAGDLHHTNDVDGGKTNERVFYRRKGDAIHAALARTLLAKKGNQSGLSEPTSTTSTSSIHDFYYYGLEDLTKEPLHQWYQTHHDMEITKQSFVTSTASWKGSGGNRWTASFICPVTGTAYDAGTLKTGRQAFDQGGAIWYKRKDDAITAAALRAYDIMNYEKFGKTEPRFCTEDPSVIHQRSTTANSGISDTLYIHAPSGDIVETDSSVHGEYSTPTISSTPKSIESAVEKDNDYTRQFIPQGVQTRNTVEDMQFVSDTSIDATATEAQVPPNSNVFVNEVALGFPKVGKSIKEELANDDDDDDDYIIQMIPQRVGTMSTDIPVAATALDLVAQTWIERGRSASTDARGVSHKTFTPEQERSRAIERAMSWVEHQREGEPQQRQKRTLFDDHRNASRLAIGKMLLESLATSHQRVPTSKEISGVENAAKSVLNFLWSSPSTAPDADCYALYIKCLEGTHSSVVSRATKILDSMTKTQTVEGHVMPLPNVAVFNSVVRRRAEGGVKTPLSDLDGREINQETLLTCLSAVAHACGNSSAGFDTQYIFDCIQKMKSLNVLSEQIDIDVYNAPMRWSGGPEGSSVSRPYSRSVPWDDLAKRFVTDDGKRNVFREQDPLVREAYALDNWCQSIENHAFGPNVRPNIETYESVVQAWIRTGTVEGIKNAEVALERLAESQAGINQFRLQTLHPLLAASAYIGDHERVNKWIDKLKESNSGLSSLLDDTRLKLVPLLARACSKSDTKLAADCSKLLESFLEENRANDKVFIDANAFILTIEAWCKQGAQDDSNRQESVEGILQTVDKFDELVSSLNHSASRESKQLLYLASMAPMVYSQTFAAMKKLGTNDKLASELWEWTDKVFRRTDEYRMLTNELSQRMNATPQECIPFYDDGYLYDYEKPIQESQHRTWPEFYGLVFAAISESPEKHEARVSECVRLCILAVEMLQKGIERESSLNRNVYKGTISALEKLVVDDPLVARLKVQLNCVLESLPAASDERQFASSNNSSTKKDVVRRRRKRDGNENRESRRPRRHTQAKKRLSQSA